MAVKKIAVVLVSSGVGLVGGTVVATPAIAVMNYRTTAGPYFPAPLVALGFLALPIGCLLFLIQASVVTYEAVARRSLGNTWLGLGAMSGLAVGILWYLFLASSRGNPWMLLAVGGIGVFQALLVFGCHGMAYKLRFAVFEK